MKPQRPCKSLTNLLTLGLILAFLGCTTQKNNAPALKWEQLFNGKDLQDWRVKIRHRDLGDNFGQTFRVEDGQIRVRYDQYTKFDEQFGHLFYKNPYSYYLIGVEYRFVGQQATGGPGWALRNSGIMLHGQDPATMQKGQDFPNSIEVQLLGGAGSGTRSTANVCTPGTQYVRNGKVVQTHCINSGSQTFHGEQWVRVEVLALGDSLIAHYVNGEEVIRYEKPQTETRDGSPGTLIRGGTISLQSESHPVDFRKVEIVNLEKYARNPAQLRAAVDKLLAEKRVAWQ